MKRLAVTISLIISVAITGCLESPYYQKQVSIPQNNWNYRFQPSFDFDITDTASLYDVYFLVRHTDAYPFSNLWMNIYTRQPGDTTFEKQRINVELAASAGRNAGQWLGRGMGEIWEHRLRLTHEGDTSILKKAGRYTIRLEQNMRINPLPEILQVGIRVEKAKPRNFSTQ